jgi:hypothetical protein
VKYFAWDDAKNAKLRKESVATLEDVGRHCQGMFNLLTFFAERNLFAAP